MIRLKFLEVIVFYEVPQIFIATDVFDTKYLCLLYPHDDESCFRYLAVKISANRLDRFKNHQIDLLSIYKSPEDDCYFDVVLNEVDGMIATPLNANQVQPFMLPDEGFYCNYNAIDDEALISYSLQSGKVMSCIAFSDADNSHNIDADILVLALDRYQAMVRNCHIKRFGRKYASDAKMRVVALQAASFDVHFMLDEPFELSGDTPRISTTLQAIDNIFSQDTPEVFKAQIEELQGNTLGSLRSFLQVLETNKLSFKHKWVNSTLEKSISSSTISLNAISRVYNYLNSHIKLEEVRTEFVGYFASGTILNNGRWTFICGKKRINGTTDDSTLFNGIILGESHQYRIKCIEHQNRRCISAKPKATYKLIECIRL